MLVSFNWLKDFVDIKLSPEALAEKLTMSGLEVEAMESLANGDTTFEINITPNRGDCLSIKGIAREIAAITGKELKEKKSSKISGSKKIADFVSVAVKDKAKCERYAARVIDKVKIVPSPKWLAERLEACGIRAINNVVDATNYMMLETGQPFHAFDLKNLHGGKIIVQTSKTPLDFITLDGTTQKITAEDLLICDENGPIAIAGVMGGANSEVKNDTTTIVLESAYFNPTSVRKTSRRLGLSTESSRRFERFIDPKATADNLNALAKLIVDIASGAATTDIIDIDNTGKEAKIKLHVDEPGKLLGIEFSAEQIKKYLKAIGVEIAKGSSSKELICTMPSWRSDITRSIDLTEEIARLHGFDKIPVTKPKIEISPSTKPSHRAINDSAKDYLSGIGYHEVVNLGFGSKNEIEPFTSLQITKIANPLGEETSALKTTLLPGLLNNLKLNVNFGQSTLKIFELRHVFAKNGSKYLEPTLLSGLLYGTRNPLGWTQKNENIDFFDMKGLCESLAERFGIEKIEFTRTDKFKFLHTHAQATITCNGSEMGFLGMIHPNIATQWGVEGNIGVFELYWDQWSELALKTKKYFCEIEKFPIVRRDVALLLNEQITSEEIVKSINEFGCKWIKNSFPFDVYKGKGIEPGKKSVAYAIFYADQTRTLTNEEVNDTHTQLIGFIKNKLGAEIR